MSAELVRVFWGDRASNACLVWWVAKETRGNAQLRTCTNPQAIKTCWAVQLSCQHLGVPFCVRCLMVLSHTVRYERY